MSSPERPRYGEVQTPEEAAAEHRVEGRQAPSYGEYAPPGWVSPVAPPVQDEAAQEATSSRSVATDTRRPDGPRGFDAPPPTGAPVPGAPPTVDRKRSFNRFATVMLLVYGAFTVITSAVSTATFGTALVSELRRLGYPVAKFESLDELHTVGTISAFASVVLFLVVALWALRRLRAGKNSWVPLFVAGVAARLVTGCFIIAVIVMDPSYAGFMNSVS